jgi:hypothetical protein
MRSKITLVLLTALGLGLGACGTTMEKKAATGAIAGAAVAGPVGAAAGAAVGAATEVVTEEQKKNPN